MQSEKFIRQLEESAKYRTHEGKIEEILFLQTAVLIAILQKLEQKPETDA